ncbi:hypothetical protein QFZ23_003800 [Arthrobacter globiformis]|uniref:hypothetical protein n=1 Tax=Arthrobacter globiformis TaxID=1665 RepID=UPI00277F7417|nr:hypothetical protein [Arthrobacter globiformis]MDQ1059899.1 hypothetical protein [Arthrobacter globiformis]
MPKKIDYGKVRDAKGMSQHRNLVLDLEEQLAFLDASCQSYDNGVHIEAKRLAVTIRVLLHDVPKVPGQRGGGSYSLLHQMGVKSKMGWWSAGAINPANLVSSNVLAWLELGQSSDGVPLGGYRSVPEGYIRQNGHKTTFDDWWGAPVIKDMAREEFTRKDLMTVLANRDGGAHIGKLNERVRRLTQQGSMGFAVGFDDGSAPWPQSAQTEDILLSPILAAMRTMAQEVVMSLQDARFMLGDVQFPQDCYAGEPLQGGIETHYILGMSLEEVPPPVDLNEP